MVDSRVPPVLIRASNRGLRKHPHSAHGRAVNQVGTQAVRTKVGPNARLREKDASVGAVGETTANGASLVRTFIAARWPDEPSQMLTVIRIVFSIRAVHQTQGRKLWELGIGRMIVAA